MTRSVRAERRVRRAARVGVLLGIVGGFFELAACEESKSTEPAKPSASAPPPYVPPAQEGCARTGLLEAVEADPACIVPRVDDSVMRDTMKNLTISLEPDSATVLGGATALLRLALTNTSDHEISIVFDAQPPGAVARPDWSRLAGVPEPKPSPSGAPVIPEGFRLMMPVRTLDTHDRSVDGLPSSPPAAASTSPRLLRVRLRSRGKLTQTVSWWALRIPVPAPISRDDAGHRYVPKTVPLPLPPAEYTIAMDLPLHGVSPPESTITTRIKVEKLDRDAASP